MKKLAYVLGCLILGGSLYYGSVILYNNGETGAGTIVNPTNNGETG